VAIIFNDSDEPLIISDLFLGKVVHTICVVKVEKLSNSIATYYKLAFYIQWDVASCSWSEEVREANETRTRQAYFGPDLPNNFLFDLISVRRFILTKLFNGESCAVRNHPVHMPKFVKVTKNLTEEFLKEDPGTNAFYLKTKEELKKDK